MSGLHPLRQPQTAPASSRSGALVDVVVLSDDLELFEAIRDAIGERNPVWRARSAEESVDLLITGRCGVLLIDLASVTAHPTTLVQQVLDQFPDVVVCVAGSRDDEPVLAPMIGEGLVYRFMHKPLSPRRALMFLQAAIRHHTEKRDGGTQTLPIPDNVVPLPSRYEPLKWVFVAIGVALFVMLLSIFSDDRSAPAEPEVAAAPEAAAPSTPGVAAPTVANPVLSRARAAFDAGRYESPPGRNALDLYKAVMLSQPDNAEARAGFDRTVDKILVNARIALEAGNTSEAQRLVDRALEADPGRRTAVLLAQQMRKMAAPPVPETTIAPALVTASSTAAPQAATSETRGNPSSAASLAVPGTPIPLPSPSKPLPGPVTRLPPIGGTVAPEATVTRMPVVIRPDPLAARVANAADLVKPPRERIYAHKVEPLPIAGYAKSREPEPVSHVAGTAAAPEEAAAPSGPVLPADSFEKLVVTDPVYPAEALRTRTQGWVQLEFTITPSGSVRDISVVEGEPKGVFDQSAADALGKWRFKPRYVNGLPATQRSTVVMHFNLEG